MIVLYADFNNFAIDGTLPLTCSGSVASIATLTTPLRDGARVWLSDGELWVEANVFRRDDGTLEARGGWEFRSKPSADLLSDTGGSTESGGVGE